MYSIERQNKILEILKEKKTVSIEKLSSILYTSSSTVRRDGSFAVRVLTL